MAVFPKNDHQIHLAVSFISCCDCKLYLSVSCRQFLVALKKLSAMVLVCNLPAVVLFLYQFVFFLAQRFLYLPICLPEVSSD